jgi:hypothetical protein
MITVRKSQDRGHFQADWLDSYHTFSFDTYYDPAHMGFRTLRVINQDRVQAGAGFPLHPHRDMEILSFVLDGALRHKDNLGREEVIRAGEVQRITAGKGVMHSEFNPSDREEVHFLQIWILPAEKGLNPSYEKKQFEPKKSNSLQLLAARDGRDGSAILHQDVALYSGEVEAGSKVEYRLSEGRHAWIQVISGELELGGQRLEAGDGAAISEERALSLAAQEKARFILFDLN